MYRKNTAGQFITFQLISTTDGSAITGVSPAVRRCIDGTFAAGGGTVTEDTGGYYKYAMAQADTNGNNIGFRFSGTGAITVALNIVTTAADPTDGVRLGLTGLANAVPGAAGGLFIAGTNAATTITSAGGDALTLSSTGTNGAGLKISGNGSGDGIKSTGGATGAALELVGGGTSGDGLKITTTSGHGMNIAATGTSMHGITSTGGNGGTSDGIKAVAGTGGVPIRGDITGNITGNLSGSAGSVTGAVGSVTGAVGSVTGNVGGNVVGSVASVTGNVGGNVVGSVASVTARVTANADQLNGDSTAAANVAKTTRAIGRGTVTAAASTTSIPTSAFSPAGGAADQFKGRIITFDADTTTSALRGQSTDITASTNAATPTFTVTALTTAPASGDTFSVT